MAPPPFLPPVCRSTTGWRQMRLISSTRSQARLYDMSMARPAAEIEPCRPMFSSRAILPGPMRSPVSRSMRRLSEGRTLGFGMDAMLSKGEPDIATPAVSEQDEAIRIMDQHFGGEMLPAL